MRGVLNSVPVDLLMIAAASLACGVVVLAVWAVRRWVPETREGFHAEVSAPMLGVAATLFGLLLAFVIIIGYQNLLDANESVSREAGALSSIVRDSAAFPAAGGADVRLAVGSYVRAVVNDEWPQMHESGKASATAGRGLDNISTAIRTFKPASSAETAFYDDAVSQLNAAITAREDRLEKAAGGLPRDLVGLILFSSVVISPTPCSSDLQTFGFTCFDQLRSRWSSRSPSWCSWTSPIRFRASYRSLQTPSRPEN